MPRNPYVMFYAAIDIKDIRNIYIAPPSVQYEDDVQNQTMIAFCPTYWYDFFVSL